MNRHPFPAEDFNVWSQQKIWPAVDFMGHGIVDFVWRFRFWMSLKLVHVTLEMHVFSKLATDQRDFYSLFSNDRDCMRLALDDVRAVFAFSGFYFCFVDKTVRMSVRETIVRGNHKLHTPFIAFRSFRTAPKNLKTTRSLRTRSNWAQNLLQTSRSLWFLRNKCKICQVFNCPTGTILLL